jgi:ATP-dependent exoDNAse (exonuclease V) alpha subunit
LRRPPQATARKHTVTSHSSQGQTADRVLVHADTEMGARDLLNNRMAYVAISRSAYDAQMNR